VAARFSFTVQDVTRFASSAEPMQATEAAVLRLAWSRRALLVG
jgi:hypothetical protein